MSDPGGGTSGNFNTGPLGSGDLGTGDGVLPGVAVTGDSGHSLPGSGNEQVEHGNSTVGAFAVPGARGGRGERGGGRGGRRKRGRAEELMVPEAEFTSYYGRPVVKAAPWTEDIPIYLFLGGLAAGSSLMGAGGDLTGRPALRRVGRLGALTGISFSMLALVHDLGRPSRFANMLRVFKPTSPMSVGTWILTAYGPGAGVAGAAELAALLPGGLGSLGFVGRLLGLAARPAGVGAALFAPAVASYTSVLLSDTATPAWHEAHREMPFVFAASAAAASSGLAMICSPLAQAGPARRMAVAGAIVEMTAEFQMERSMGMTAEAMHDGRAGRLMRLSKTFMTAGAVSTALFARRSRTGAVISGLMLMTGSVCTRFGIFDAGMDSARDPRYTVVPQRERLDRRNAERAKEAAFQAGARD